MIALPPGVVRLALALSSLAAFIHPAHAQVFIALGKLPGTFGSAASGVSADGSVVVGANYDTAAVKAIRWTRAAGLIDLGALPGATQTSAAAVSADGSVIVGSSGTPSLPVRWTYPAGIAAMGLLPGGLNASCWGLNADGSVAAGAGDSVSGSGDHVQVAVRWTADGTPEMLGVLPGGASSSGSGVSADGSTIVGSSDVSDPASGVLRSRAFSWTRLGGMVALPMPPGTNFSAAAGATPDGSIIVGMTGRNAPDLNARFQRATRWTAAAGPESLATVDSAASAVSADGTRVVGALGNPWFLVDGTAMLWTSEIGAQDLNTYLPALGADLTNWTLTGVSAITPDGRTIVGNGLHYGNPEGWIAVLPATLLPVPVPCVDLQGPQNALVCAPGTAHFQVSAPAAAGPYTYRWQIHNLGFWTTLQAGAQMLPCAGGGATSVSTSDPTGPSTIISIQPCPGLRSYSIQAVVTNACGSVVSPPVTYRICPANFDCDEVLGLNDIFAFLAAWFAGDPRADMDGVPGLSEDDIYAFVSQWFAGCDW